MDPLDREITYYFIWAAFTWSRGNPRDRLTGSSSRDPVVLNAVHAGSAILPRFSGDGDAGSAGSKN